MIMEQVSHRTTASNVIRLGEPSLDALHRGDPEVFNDLVSRYQRAAYQRAYRILADRAAAEDAIQNAFLDAFRGIRSFHGGSFRAWLMQIVTYTCYDELRRELRHPRISLEQSNEDDYEPSSWLIDRSQPSPEEEFERIELGEMVRKILNHLPSDLRTISLLVDWEELDYLEASRRIRRPVGTVRVVYFDLGTSCENI